MQALVVCKRGHLIATKKRGETIRDLHAVARFCPDCSAPLIDRCENCSLIITWIQRPVPQVPPYMWESELPDFCSNCQHPYPWENKEKRLAALYNLIDFEPDLDEATRFEVIEQIAVLSAPDEGPEAEARKIEAARRLRELAPKAVSMGGDLLKELFAESVLKVLGL